MKLFKINSLEVLEININNIFIILILISLNNYYFNFFSYEQKIFIHEVL